MTFRLVPLVFLYLLVLSPAAGQVPARPNFLFVITDDQRYDAMSVVQQEQGERARFPFFQTPNMDRLAREGVRFRNAFVVSSLCSPSRAAFLTGRYNHLNGVANNATPFPKDQVTVAHLLRDAGYRTGYVGKFHMGQDPERPGFDYVASFIGQGRYNDCPVLVNGRRVASKGWVDDVSTDYALEFLREQPRREGKPFFLFVGFKSSHGPWTPPARLADKYEDATVKPPVSLDSPPAYQGWVAPNSPNRRAMGERRAGAADNTRDRMARQYFRTLAGVDENLGRLLAALDELKLAENTVVVFTSDNGFYLREHGLGDKRSAYEESIRIPLLLRYPKLFPRPKVLDPIVLNIDLAPTFLELAGVKTPEAMQGKSWRPLLEGQPAPGWRTAFFYEYFYERFFNIPTTLAVRTETHKLIKYPGHDEWTELFDLRADPYEMKNLYRDPAQAELRKRMEAEFERQAKLAAFLVPAYAHTFEPPGQP